MVFPYDLESQPYYVWGEQIWYNNSTLEQTKKFLSYRSECSTSYVISQFSTVTNIMRKGTIFLWSYPQSMYITLQDSEWCWSYPDFQVTIHPPPQQQNHQGLSWLLSKM
jgi:hypothetical protein